LFKHRISQVFSATDFAALVTVMLYWVAGRLLLMRKGLLAVVAAFGWCIILTLA